MLKHSQQRCGPCPLTNTAISCGRETSPIDKAPGVRNLTASTPSYPWSGLLVNHTTFITGADMTTLPPRTALALEPATQAALGRSCSRAAGCKKSTGTQAHPGSTQRSQESCKESRAARRNAGRLRHTPSAQPADSPSRDSNPTLSRAVRRRELGAAAVALGCASPAEPRASGLAHSPLGPWPASRRTATSSVLGRSVRRGPRSWDKGAWLNRYLSMPFVPGPSVRPLLLLMAHAFALGGSCRAAPLSSPSSQLGS